MAAAIRFLEDILLPRSIILIVRDRPSYKTVDIRPCSVPGSRKGVPTSLPYFECSISFLGVSGCTLGDRRFDGRMR